MILGSNIRESFICSVCNTYIMLHRKNGTHAGTLQPLMSQIVRRYNWHCV